MQLSRGGVGKSHHHLVEVLIKLVDVRNNLEVMPLLNRRRCNVQVAFTPENRARHLAVHLAIKRNVPMAKREDGRVPMQIQVAHRNHFAARQEAAQLLVVGIAVGGALGLQR